MEQQCLATPEQRESKHRQRITRISDYRTILDSMRPGARGRAASVSDFICRVVTFSEFYKDPTSFHRGHVIGRPGLPHLRQ